MHIPFGALPEQLLIAAFATLAKKYMHPHTVRPRCYCSPYKDYISPYLALGFRILKKYLGHTFFIVNSLFN